MTQKFDVTGMTCSACSAHVDKSVRKLSGVSNVNVNLLQNSMSVEYDEKSLSTDDIISAVEKGGYGASVKGAKTEAAPAKQDATKPVLHRLVISFCFLIPLLYLAMGHMFGAPIPGFLSGEENMMSFALVQFLLTLPIIYEGRSYFQKGFKSLFHASPNMDSLVAIGAAAAMVYSIYAMFQMGYYLGHGNLMTAHTYAGELYFESAAMILTLITLGKYLEARSKRRTGDAIAALMDLSPKTAVVIRSGIEQTVPAEAVVVGDTVVLKSGMSVPVDGTVTEGGAAVDESAITGESIPAEKAADSTVIGGTVVKSGYLRYTASRVGEDTTLAQIIRLVEDAGGSKAPIAKLADKVSGVFVPIVMSIAVIAAIIWLILGYPFHFALSIGIAVLVISCPCALGLATPTAIMVGTGRGAENGILIKSAESLEVAHKINTVVLDKTGTVTTGKPAVTDLLPADGVGEQELLTFAAALEARSEHPLAAAIVEYAAQQKTAAPEAENFGADPQGGVFAEVDGRKVLGGNRRFMEKNAVDISGADAAADAAAADGKTPLYFAADGSYIGMICVADVMKPSSPAAVKSLKKMGIDVIMLTGDNTKTAQAVGRAAGIDKIVAEVLPADKEREVARLQQNGKIVAMIGDGINDAPALTRADVGIAIGAGTDIAAQSADIILMRSELTSAVSAIRLSKATIRNIKQNLFWAFIYNIIGIPLAAGVLYSMSGLKLSPMFAAAAMSFSSVFVVLNALRLKLWKDKENDTKAVRQQAVPQKKENEIMKKTVMIKGMMCGHCTAHVTKALEELPGVKADVNLKDGAAYLTLANDVADGTIIKAVSDAGYEVTEIK